MKLILNDKNDHENLEVGMFCQVVAVNRHEGYLTVETDLAQQIPPWCAHATRLRVCDACKKHNEQKRSK
jgi:hypothetical protein